MESIKDIIDLKNKKVFLRVDFNVPLARLSAIGYQLSAINKNYRIKAHKETIDFLVSQGARIALVTHSEKDNLRNIFEDIKKILGLDIGFEEDILNPRLESQITLFENIRRYDGEEKNEPKFALSLSKGFDIYVNDAFSESHRDYASITGVPIFLPSYAGLNLLREVENLNKIINAPSEGKILIIGGAKVETKAPVIKNFLDRAEKILLGGAVANLFLKKSGIEISNSVSGNPQLIEGIDSAKIVLPQDAIIGTSPIENKSESMALGNVPVGNMILDIGPGTLDSYKEILRNAKTVIWNGPMGYIENRNFEKGTKELADFIAVNKIYSVVGGGDTVAFLEKENMLDKFSYVSTGGGAMLEFLAGKRLPGLEALGYYE